MASKFRLRIITEHNDKVVEFEPGLAAEIDFVDECVSHILAKGVGLFHTSAHVEQDIRDGIEEVIYGLKAKIKP